MRWSVGEAEVIKVKELCEASVALVNFLGCAMVPRAHKSPALQVPNAREALQGSLQVPNARESLQGSIRKTNYAFSRSLAQPACVLRRPMLEQARTISRA